MICFKLEVLSIFTTKLSLIYTLSIRKKKSNSIFDMDFFFYGRR